jgi:hypothetical protein
VSKLVKGVFLPAAALVMLAASAATAPAATREAWSGTYQCGPMSETGGRGYTSHVRMLIEDGEARIVRESAQIKESMSGRVAPDGTLELEGTGARKQGGSGWLYRFEGRIDGNRFEARGAMLSPGHATRLRECSMSLTRMRSASTPAAPAPSVKPKSSSDTKPVPPVVAEALTPTLAESLAAKPRAAAEPVERELDFVGKADTAAVEGTVVRAVPHRYLINARRGQRLNATLESVGARLDLYEPGSTLSLLSGGFIVQGSTLGATTEGDRIDVDLPAGGKYLLLVRSNADEAFYTLELKVEDPEPSLAETWLEDERVRIGAVIAVIVFALFAFIRRKRDRRLFKSG